MRKDYIKSFDSSDIDETDFVEAHWTKIWEQEGGPKGRIDRIARQEEYRLMIPYLRNMHKGASILDGGCGTGDWVLSLASEDFDVTGLDLSRKTVAQLQARFPKAKFSAGDIRATEFPDSTFDAYFSWGVFEHFESGPQYCIREAVRILKPGGLLFVSVPHDNLRHALRTVFEFHSPQSEAVRFYQYRFTRSELARELAIGGLHVQKIQPIHKRQGLLRALHHWFGLPYHWAFTRGLAATLSIFIPGTVISHMIFAVARKPGSAITLNSQNE
jgi:ubiquinone/menaquinone biosynthesis C-methylase UbiE